MGVVKPEARGEWNTTDPCFQCGGDIERQNHVVYWAGSGGRHGIALHWYCAAKLGTDLIGDARECQIENGEAPWRQPQRVSKPDWKWGL